MYLVRAYSIGCLKTLDIVQKHTAKSIAVAYPGGLWGPRPPGVSEGAPKKGKGKKRERKKGKERGNEERKKGTKGGKIGKST